MRYFFVILLIGYSSICWGQTERETVMSLWQEAEQFMTNEQWLEARTKSSQAYTIAKNEEWGDGILSSLRLLSRIAEKEEKTELILQYKLTTLDYNLKNGDHESIYESYSDLAKLYRKQEIYNKSITYFHSALAFVSPQNKYGAQEHFIEELAFTHRLNSNLDSARFYYNFLIDKKKKENNFDAQLYFQQQIADTYATERKHNKSVEIYKKILVLSTKRNDKKNEAIAFNNIGIAYTQSGNYESALDSLKRAEEICGEKPLVDLSILFSNMGIAYHNLKNKDKSVEYLLKAIKFAKEGEEKYQLNHTLSKIYLENDDLYNAEFQNDFVYKNTNNEKLKSESLKTAADIKEGLYDFEKAFDFYQQHLNLENQFSIDNNLEKQKLLELKSKLERSEKEIRLEMAAKEIEENKIKAEQEKLLLENEQNRLEKENLALENEKREKELALLSQEQKAKEAQIQAQESELKASKLESETQKQQLALTQQRLQSEMSERALKDAQQTQKLQQLELKAAQDSEQMKQKELVIAQEAQKAQADLLKEQQRTSKIIRTVAMIGGIAAALIIGLVLWFLGMSRRKNKQLAQQNDEIEEQRYQLEKSNEIIAIEQQKSENLLLNILPGAIAIELKEKGFATPKEYKLVTVLFTDFGGFTKVTEQMNPDDLIDELNTCFTAFDDIIEKYGMQPIKTIGDSYMCAGGVPIEGSTSPTQVTHAALEINAFMNKRLAEKNDQNVPYWDTRIGLHSGSVIAGVVGKKKFAYDIWGDAVNTASRMESGAIPNTVNVSEATYQLIKDDFKCTYRGIFDVKNKGKMKMYQVENLDA